MKQLVSRTLERLAAGEKVVWCSILASSGSSPRGAGARMAVFADGSFLGTVGGGAVEQHALAEAMEVHRSGAEHARSFCLRPNEVADIGMICGGNVTVYFQYLTEKDVPALETMLRAMGEHADAWLCCLLREGKIADMGVYIRGEGLLHAGALTPAEVEPILGPDAVYRKGEPGCYAEPISQGARVYVFGCGHVSRELVPVLAHVGFSVTVYDNRPALATREHFPAADQVLVGEFTRFGEQITITDRDYVVIMTPGHQADYEVLERVLRTPARYVGCIGSRAKVAATQKKLREAGIPEADIQRTVSPIGLPIGGETPAEIAISIAAQMIACRSGKLEQFR